MPRPLIALLLAAAFAVPSPSAAGTRTETFIAETNGSLVLGSDGRVVSVDLEGEDVLGAETIAGFEELVRGWRLEPVVRDGRPVPAKGHVQLALVAQSVPGTEQVSLAVRDAWFVDPPGTRRDEAKIPTRRLTPPVYPRRPMTAGVGAEVMLLIELADDGSVAHVATEDVSLLGAPTGPASDGYARTLARASERVAEDWSIPEFAGRVVRVPIRYSTVRGGGWQRLHDYDWTPDQWVLVKLAEPMAITSLSSSGQPSTLKLVDDAAAGTPDGG